MPEILLLGSNDVTRAVGDAVLRAGIGISGVVSTARSFSISYSQAPVTNSRFFDMSDWCAANGVRFITYQSNDALLRELGQTPIAACLVAGWYFMVPRRIREKFQFGAIGFHASLLPQLRGGAPLNWALLSGLSETGLSMFELTDGVDDGPVYGQYRIPIRPQTRVGELVAATIEGAAALTGGLLPGILEGRIKPKRQSGTSTYSLQREPDDGRIDWQKSAVLIDRLVRATSEPYPGAFTFLEGQKIVIWRSVPLDVPVVLGKPGQIAKLPGVSHPCVVTGEGVLQVLEATDRAGNPAGGVLNKASNKRFSDRI